MGCISRSSFDPNSSDDTRSFLVQLQINQTNPITNQTPYHQTTNNLEGTTHSHEKNPNKNQESDLIKQIDFKILIEQFKVSYRKEFEDELAHVKKYDIKTLEIVIRALYTHIIEDKLMSVNRMEINMKKCKVHIAQALLSIILKTINFTIDKYSIQHANAMFNKLQKFSKTLCTFLKTKYPRGQDVDAGKLGKQFKEFDCTDDFEHDIVANAQVVFKTKGKTFKFTPRKAPTKKKKILKNTRVPEVIQRKVSQGVRGESVDDDSSNNENDDQAEGDKGEEFEIVQDPGEQSDPNSQQAEDKRYENDFEITNNIKIFLNRIMDEIDDYYLKFCEMFKLIHPQFKVSRKISENTAKCSLLDTGVVEINSIQVVRVLVKWLQDLEAFISKPEEPLTSNYEVKVTKYEKYNYYSTVQQINESKYQLKSNLKYLMSQSRQLEKLLNQGEIIDRFKTQYKKLIINQNEQKYEEYFKEFSTFILKNLQHVVLDQRQISLQQTEIVKYAYEMSALISWMVEQKLISVIKSLTKVAEKYKLKNGVPNFIKFKVNDLMRCQLSGDQQTIKDVYKKILQQQQNKNIQIVKIKNRFHTDNHDAVILFKMKGSFLICECQLALADQNYKNDSRNAHIYELNHFLYELQRSPFGIIGQLCVFLKTQSHTVSSYYNKLKLKPSPERLQSMKQCLKQKLLRSNVKRNTTGQFNQTMQSSVGKFKLRPYVCSVCFKYFYKFANFSKKMLECIDCVTNICEPCQLEKLNDEKKKASSDNKAGNQKEELKSIYHDLEIHMIKMANQSQNEQKLDENQVKLNLTSILQPLLIESIRTNAEQESKKFKESVIEELIKKEESQNLKEPDNQNEKQNQSEQKRETKLRAEHLMKYFQRTETQAIKKGWKIHFVIFSKIANRQKLSLYRYDSYESVIQNVYCPIEKYLKHEQIKLNESSRIFTFKTVWRTSVSKKVKFKNEGEKRLTNIPEQKVEQERKNRQEITSYSRRGKNQSESKKDQKQENSSKNPTQELKNIKNLLQTYEQKVQKENITSNSPDDDEEKSVHQGSVKADEEKKLDDKTKEFAEILKQSIHPFEYQRQMKLYQSIKPDRHEFYFVECKDQKIKNSSSIYILIDAQISKRNRQGLEIINHLSRFSTIKNLKKKIDLSNLALGDKQIGVVKNQISKKKTGTKSNEFSLQWIKEIETLDLSKNRITEIKLLPNIFLNLEFLDISQNSVRNLDCYIGFKKLKELKAEDNLITSVKNFKNFKQLMVVNLSQNQIHQFICDQPNFNIKQLNISRNFINNLEKFAGLKSLQILIADRNYVENLDGNSFSKQLKTLSLANNKLKQADNLDSLQRLQKINLEANQLVKFKIMKQLKKLQSINLSGNPLNKLKIQYTSNIRQMYLDEMNLSDRKLIKMVFADKNFEKLEILSLNKNKLTKFPYLQRALTAKQGNWHPFIKKPTFALKELRIAKNPILYGLNLDISVEIFQDYDFLDEEQDEETRKQTVVSGEVQKMHPELWGLDFKDQIEKQVIEQSPVFYSSNMSLNLKFNERQLNNVSEQKVDSTEAEDSFFDFLKQELESQAEEQEAPQPQQNEKEQELVQAEQQMNQQAGSKLVQNAENEQEEPSEGQEKEVNQQNQKNQENNQQNHSEKHPINQTEQNHIAQSIPMHIKPKQQQEEPKQNKYELGSVDPNNEEQILRTIFQFIIPMTEKQLQDNTQLSHQNNAPKQDTNQTIPNQPALQPNSSAQNTDLQQVPSPPVFSVPPQSESPEPEGSEPSEDNRSEKSSEGYVSQQGEERPEQQLFDENLTNIKWLLTHNVLFQIPVEENLFRSKHNGFYEQLLKIIKELQPEREKLRFNHFSKRQVDQNRRDENFFKQRPQTKVSKVYSTIANKKNSKTQAQIDFTQSVNYIYFKRVLTETDIPYYYVKDQENAAFYKFWHPDYDINMQQFLVFDWTLLSFLDIRSCQINDEKWALFCQHAEEKFPNLKKVNLSFNDIKTVTITQLRKFKAPRANIWFYDSSGYKDDNNQLTESSQAVIKKFNLESRGKRWAISNDDEIAEFEESYNKDEQVKDE